MLRVSFISIKLEKRVMQAENVSHICNLKTFKNHIF